MRLEGRRDEALDDRRTRPRAHRARSPGPPAPRPRPAALLGQVLRDTAQIQSEQGHPREAIDDPRAHARDRGRDWPRRTPARSPPQDPHGPGPRPAGPGPVGAARRARRRRWRPISKPSSSSRRSPASTRSWPMRPTPWRWTWATWPTSSRWPASWIRPSRAAAGRSRSSSGSTGSIPGVLNYRGGAGQQPTT